MVDFAANDKLLLLSQIDIDDDSNSSDHSDPHEHPVFNTNQPSRSFAKSRASTRTNLFQHPKQQPNTTSNKLSRSWFKYSLLMVNSILSGLSFALLIFSRTYFTHQFSLGKAMSTNLLLTYLLAILLGISLGNLLVTTRNDRFHLLFASAALSSLCILSIIHVHTVSAVCIFMGVFGLCTGLSTTIAIRWCLSLEDPRPTQNIQTNVLQILTVAGMIAFFCFLATNFGQSTAYADTPGANQSSLHVPLITTTTPKVHLKKPESADGIFLEQSHVTKPTPVERRKRQFIQAETTTTTTEKVHLKKPESADGELLEQSHITKPVDLAGSTTTERARELLERFDNGYIDRSSELAECLHKLERRCVFRVEKCRVEEEASKTLEPVVAANLTGRKKGVK